jgi:ATP-dependent DNA helicase RecQ
MLARDLGPGTLSYHAGQSAQEHTQTLEAFVENTMLVATNCFGLGVDLSDVRTVIHYGLPRSLLAYVQECGRAGRDGQNATCVLFFASPDLCKYNTTERDVRLATEMLEWTKETQCRHRTLRLSFGEEPGPSIPCVWGLDTTQAGCDVCRGTHERPGEIAPTVTSQDIRILLQAIVTTGNHTGKRLPIDFLLGSKSKKVARFASCFCYRSGTHKTRDEWMVLHTHLQYLHLLRETVTPRGYLVYKITAAGRLFLTQTEDDDSLS